MEFYMMKGKETSGGLVRSAGSKKAFSADLGKNLHFKYWKLNRAKKLSPG